MTRLACVNRDGVTRRRQMLALRDHLVRAWRHVGDLELAVVAGCGLPSGADDEDGGAVNRIAAVSSVTRPEIVPTDGWADTELTASTAINTLASPKRNETRLMA